MRFFCFTCKRITTWRYTGMGIAVRCCRCGTVKLADDMVEFVTIGGHP